MSSRTAQAAAMPKTFDLKYVPADTPVVAGGLRALINGHAAVCFEGFFKQDEIAPTIKAVYGGREDWSTGFEGLQYCLGEAWYHYAEEAIGFEEYSARAAQARANVEKHVPGLEDKVRAFLQTHISPQSVDVREGWAGPGIMVFPARNYVATKGGSVHFDTDAFTDEELADPSLEMYSFVCMLQKPAQGGNLRIWDTHYDTSDCDREQEFTPTDHPEVAMAEVVYKPGDLWMFEGMRAHQITAFGGDDDRIALTFHVAKRDGNWDIWF